MPTAQDCANRVAGNAGLALDGPNALALSVQDVYFHLDLLLQHANDSSPRVQVGQFSTGGVGQFYSGANKAEVEDMQADWQASVVVLFADDTLRRLIRQLNVSTLQCKFGPIYNDGIALTELLRAAGNAIRHASEWDDNQALTFPYDPRQMRCNRSSARRSGQWTDKDDRLYADALRALRNIRIFQRAFGIGKNEPIREMQSWRVLVTMDGLYGTRGPDYARIERAIILAAKDVAIQAGRESTERLDDSLRSMSLVPLED